jgi:amino acid transporter
MAFHILITFWTDKILVEATVIVVFIAYAALNCFSVKWFGIEEFYLTIGKIGLILMCFTFTFSTMVGVNPIGDAYGLRYWNDPGPFAECLTTRSLGNFWGFLSCMSTCKLRGLRSRVHCLSRCRDQDTSENHAGLL